MGDGRCYLSPSSNGNGGRTLDVEHNADDLFGDNVQLYEKCQGTGAVIYIQEEVEEEADAILLASTAGFGNDFC